MYVWKFFFKSKARINLGDKLLLWVDLEFLFGGNGSWFKYRSWFIKYVISLSLLFVYLISISLERYLENSGCVGMCVNMCKTPTQDFFTNEFGLPLTMIPSMSYCLWLLSKVHCVLLYLRSSLVQMIFTTMTQETWIGQKHM